MIGIVDYGSGNISAICTILNDIKADFIVTNQVCKLKNADGFILPGVGSFDPTMRSLDSIKLKQFLDIQVLEKKKYILGICVGMHLLASESEEGKLPGLNYIPGKVKKIDIKNLKTVPHLPHMGWNSLERNIDDPLIHNLDLKYGFYFLHSYYFHTFSKENIVASVCYGKKIPCVVRKDNVWGVQFHPEKSHSNGYKLISNFVKLCTC